MHKLPLIGTRKIESLHGPPAARWATIVEGVGYAFAGLSHALRGAFCRFTLTATQRIQASFGPALEKL